MLCSFAMMGNSRHRYQCGPVIQKHFPLTHIAPNPECGQVDGQVVLLCLRSHTTFSLGEKQQQLLMYICCAFITNVMVWSCRRDLYLMCYLCMLGAVVRVGFSTTNIWAVTLENRNTVFDKTLQLTDHLTLCKAVSSCWYFRVKNDTIQFF